MKIQTLPHTSPLTYTLRSGSATPLISITLNNITAKYNSGIELTTKGDFVAALDTFRSCLQSIPLVILKSKKDASELQDLIRKISEYITAMRIELERKKLVGTASQTDEVKTRIAELSAYMTLCGMEIAHKFLAYKNAMNTVYKLENFINAAHFAR
jgi:coatomer protein complex subunit alpha (xenin)